MKSQVIVDTGPLVALLNSRDKHHAWVVQQLGDIQPPMVTCEAVLAEATYLTRAVPGASNRSDSLIRRPPMKPVKIRDGVASSSMA